jgi:hypothetical protein
VGDAGAGGQAFLVRRLLPGRRLGLEEALDLADAPLHTLLGEASEGDAAAGEDGPTNADFFWDWEG